MKPGDTCGRNNCTGILQRWNLGYQPQPRPSQTLRCNKCQHVHLTVTEGDSEVEVWLIDQGSAESFADFIKRTREGNGGPGEYML